MVDDIGSNVPGAVIAHSHTEIGPTTNGATPASYFDSYPEGGEGKETYNSGVTGGAANYAAGRTVLYCVKD